MWEQHSSHHMAVAAHNGAADETPASSNHGRRRHHHHHHHHHPSSSSSSTAHPTPTPTVVLCLCALLAALAPPAHGAAPAPAPPSTTTTTTTTPPPPPSPPLQLHLSEPAGFSGYRYHRHGCVLTAAATSLGGGVAVEGPLVVAVVWPGGSTEMTVAVGSPPPRRCGGGPCVVLETARAPSVLRTGVAATAAAHGGAFVSATMAANGTVTLRILHDAFGVYPPDEEGVTLAVAAAAYQDAAAAAAAAVAPQAPALIAPCGGSEPPVMRDAKRGEAMACGCGWCAARVSLQTAQLTLPLTEAERLEWKAAQGAMLALAGLSAVVPVTGAMTAGNMVRMAAIARVCPQRGEVQLDVSLNPLRWTIGDGPSRQVDGAVVGGITLQFALMLLVVVAGLVLSKGLVRETAAARRFDDDVVPLAASNGSGVAPKGGKVPVQRVVSRGTVGAHTEYLLARARFGWMVVPAVYLLAGTSMAATSALLYSAPAFRVVALVDLLLFVGGIIALSCYFAKHSGMHASCVAVDCSRDGRVAGVLRAVFWGTEEWVPRMPEDAAWFELSHLWYDSYKEGFQFHMLFEILAAMIFGGLSAWAPQTSTLCWVKSASMQTIMASCFLVLLVWRPYLSHFDNASLAIILLGQIATLSFVMITDHVDDPDHWTATLAGKVSVSTALLIMAKAVIDVTIFFIDEYNVWADLGDGANGHLPLPRRVAAFVRHLLCCGNATGLRMRDHVARQCAAPPYAYEHALTPRPASTDDDDGATPVALVRASACASFASAPTFDQRDRTDSWADDELLREPLTLACHQSGTLSPGGGGGLDSSRGHDVTLCDASPLARQTSGGVAPVSPAVPPLPLRMSGTPTLPWAAARGSRPVSPALSTASGPPSRRRMPSFRLLEQTSSLASLAAVEAAADTPVAADTSRSLLPTRRQTSGRLRATTSLSLPTGSSMGASSPPAMHPPLPPSPPPSVAV